MGTVVYRELDEIETVSTALRFSSIIASNARDHPLHASA